MMRLSTMWAVDRTIDADGRSPIADEILAAWGHDPGTARFFRSSANFIYTFDRAGDRWGRAPRLVPRGLVLRSLETYQRRRGARPDGWKKRPKP